MLQSLPEKSAGVLAAAVGVEDGAAEREAACGGLKRIDTQLGTHIAVHAQGEDLSVETIHDRWDVQPAVGALNLRDVGQKLSPRPVSVNVLMEQVFHCQWGPHKFFIFRKPGRKVCVKGDKGQSR